MTGSAADATQSPPLTREAGKEVREFTVRALLTGMVLGGVLSLCNIYTGLLIGWGFNMSITAALLGFGFWQTMRATTGTQYWGILENNINQTAASSAASISSAGLVAPIPALTMLTGYEFSWHVLAIWTFSVTLVGIVVAIGLRKQMLLVDKLPYPGGFATGQTVKEMYARGKEAMVRVKMLLLGAVIASATKIIVTITKFKAIGLPGTLKAGGAVKAKGITAISLKNLTFALNPSWLLMGGGAIIGIRAGISLLLGAIIAWGFVGPYALDMGWAEPGGADKQWFGTMVKWLLWPGVAMMVTSALTSFAFSWRSIVAAITGTKFASQESDADYQDSTDQVPRRIFVASIAFVLLLSVITQVGFFDITWWTAALGVFLTFLLAIVAARVTGETGVTPVGAMGKVTQLTFGAISPGNVSANLMAANVTGGAASQCGDLLHDMKTGLMVGASARLQSMAQVCGALAGAMIGSLGYLILIPNPKEQLLTPEWPAPAVAAWKAVAEVFKDGIEALPAGAAEAMLIAGIAGIVLAILEKSLPENRRKWVPSPVSIGLAFVINAHYSMSMFFGALIAYFLTRWVEDWSKRFIIVLASGLIAGESITGVGIAIQKILANAG